MDDLCAAWRSWAEDNGHARKTKQTFGRDLRAAVPQFRSSGSATARTATRLPRHRSPSNRHAPTERSA